jgi:hypothetical protein
VTKETISQREIFDGEHTLFNLEASQNGATCWLSNQLALQADPLEEAVPKLISMKGSPTSWSAWGAALYAD